MQNRNKKTIDLVLAWYNDSISSVTKELDSAVIPESASKEIIEQFQELRNFFDKLPNTDMLEAQLIGYLDDISGLVKWLNDKGINQEILNKVNTGLWVYFEDHEFEFDLSDDGMDETEAQLDSVIAFFNKILDYNEPQYPSFVAELWVADEYLNQSQFYWDRDKMNSLIETIKNCEQIYSISSVELLIEKYNE